MSWPTARPTASKRGRAPIPACRSSAATAPAPTPKPSAAHGACWAKAGPQPREGTRAVTTRERWRQVHDLLDKGVGLLECSRHLNLSLNTVKRYARAAEPDRLVRAPQYRGIHRSSCGTRAYSRRRESPSPVSR